MSVFIEHYYWQMTLMRAADRGGSTPAGTDERPVLAVFDALLMAREFLNRELIGLPRRQGIP